ncbi:MAG TPA: glycosyltransferase family 4 protein, partial [Verrucomicrobiae bacterium]|nr:glycosyltransferase family 4 protein [Verrucomicrobiae bacterium]
MKVLFVTPEFPPDFGGGIIRYVRDLAIALQEQGCHVSVLKGSAFVHGAKAYELEGIPISVLETSRFEHWLDRFDHFSMFPELRRHLAAAFALHEQARAGEGSDAVEVTDWGMLFLPWVMESSARVLVQMHGSTGQIAAREPVVGREAEGIFFMLLERSVLGDSSNLSAYSRANANWWQALLGKPVNYTPPPLHCAATEVSPISPDRHWLAVGRIQHWKGPQVACAAWQRLGNDAPPLQWIGRDTSHGASGLATDIWLGKEFPAIWRRTIQPVGQFRPDEVLQRMVAAKVVLVPSLWDTFNLVAVEAMALGKVVVISDGAGAVDLVEHGVNGFVFPNGDASAL